MILALPGQIFGKNDRRNALEYVPSCNRLVQNKKKAKKSFCLRTYGNAWPLLTRAGCVWSFWGGHVFATSASNVLDPEQKEQDRSPSSTLSMAISIIPNVWLSSSYYSMRHSWRTIFGAISLNQLARKHHAHSRVPGVTILTFLKARGCSGRVFAAINSVSLKTSTKKVAVSPSSSVHGDQYYTQCVAFVCVDIASSIHSLLSGKLVLRCMRCAPPSKLT